MELTYTEFKNQVADKAIKVYDGLVIVNDVREFYPDRLNDAVDAVIDEMKTESAVW